MENIISMVDYVIDRHRKPAPRFTLKAQFERAVHYEEMREKSAQLETLRTLECAFRADLANALSMLGYNARRGSDKISVRVWESMDTTIVDQYIDLYREAQDKHADALRGIAHLEATLQDMQNTLDDAELWEQEGGAA